MAPRLQIVQELPQVGRKMRRPAHTFQVRARPWVIQPFMIAPVLPGETLKQAMIQVRAVTDPIKNPLIGWWLEHYVFYCPFSSLPNADALQELMISASANLSAISSTSVQNHYHKNGPNFVRECLQAVTEEFFRAPNEVWDAYTIGGFPIAQVNSESWLDSVLPLSDIPTGDGVAVDEVVGVYDALDDRRLMYERIKQLGMTEATYDDWLRMSGISVPASENVDTDPVTRKPELLRFSRDWKYPSNTINASTGVPTSAVSWAVSERLDKDRFFREPGFIFGVTICRPKVYFSRQYGFAASLMDNALNWLPAMAHEAAASILQVTKTVGPLGSGVADATSPSEDYVVDLRDLLLYGDQFTNISLTDLTANFVALPSAAMQKRYISQTDVDNLFVGAGSANQEVSQDGIVSMHILGRQVDQTPTRNS